MTKTTTKANELSKGTEIYYTGDTANHEGFGVIVNTSHDRWGDHIEVLMNDEDSREGDSIRNRTSHLSPLNFAEGPGQRFMTKATYTARREAKIADMQARFREMGIGTN